MNTPTNLVYVKEVLKDIGVGSGILGHEESLLNEIKRRGITITAEIPYGRGFLRLITPEEARRVREKFGVKEAETKTSVDPQVHITALEAKVDRLQATLQSNTDAMQLLLKQNNILCDRLLTVLKDLGHTDPANGAKDLQEKLSTSARA